MVSFEEIRAFLISTVSTILGISSDRLCLTGSLARYGIDSLQVIQIKNSIHTRYNIEIPLKDLFQGVSIEDLVEIISRSAPVAQDCSAEFSAEFHEVNEVRLSLNQKSLWFHYKLDPESVAYNIYLAFRLEEPIEKTVLQLALQKLVDRHPMLRTLYRGGDEPVQFNSNQLLHVHEIDASNWADKQLRSYMEFQADRPFDLENGPVFRAHLFLRSHDAILLLCAHHICVDFWSLEIIARELNTIYQSERSKAPLCLGPVPAQYREFIYWQDRLLNDSHLSGVKSYWEKELSFESGGFPSLELPMDRPRPPQQTFRGECKEFSINRDLYHRLRDLSTENNTSLFVTLLAAYKALLYRYTGQGDLIVGVPALGRHCSKFENTVGYFVNPIPIRSQIVKQTTFRKFLNQVRGKVIDGLNHQNYPMLAMIDHLKIPRNGSTPPLFQVSFSWESAHNREPGFEWFAVGQRGAALDMNFSVFPSEDSLRIAVQYNSDLFNVDRIERMTRHFETMLSEISKNPDIEISRLPILTESERQQILVQWNDTERKYAKEKCIHQIFEDQAESTPKHTAVTFKNEKLDYQNLNERANQLAHFLRKLGVTRGTMVGFCLDRSLEMVITIFGIIKAGGAYLPIEPSCPRERALFMLDDSAASILITQSRLMETFSGLNMPVIPIDSDWKNIAEQPRNNLPNICIPNDLVYMIYTSGSTGQPKGVRIPHIALSNLVASMKEDLQIKENDIFAAAAPISFDMSVMEVFLPLSTGACIIVVPKNTISDPGQMSLIIGDATLMQGTPSTWRMLIESGWKGSSKLRVLCGGERMSSELCKQLLPKVKELWNMYGPTETTVWSAMRRMDFDTGQITVGRPIGNTLIVIANSELEIQPIGIPGELLIGGDGVCMGYHNRPELNSSKFVTPSFLPNYSGRIFRTGDLARYTPEGEIEVLGRIDDQVKLRGYRIELGEIESVLCQFDKVKEAAVVVCEDYSGEKKLVAYLVGEVSQEIRSILKEKIPDYMIPSAFVHLDRFPLSPNGKVDKKALASLHTLNNSSRDYVAPSTPLESKIAGIISEILQVKDLSIHEKLFDVGCTSLQAVRIANKMSLVFGDVSVRDIFEYPSIAALAKHISKSLQVITSPFSNNACETFGSKSEKCNGNNHPYLEVTNRPLSSLIEGGEIPQIDSAALGYLPSSMILSGINSEKVSKFFEDAPLLTNVLETSFGRIGIMLLPITSFGLSEEPAILTERINKAIRFANKMGAQSVSLTGLIPSVTDYGRIIFPQYSGDRNAPLLTTGHNLTVSSVVLTMEKSLQIASRQIECETVGFLGLGSIGLCALRLSLLCLPHPRKLILCDVFSKKDLLSQLSNEIVHKYGFKGEVSVLAASPMVPKEFYRSTLVVGATNVADILDVDSFLPGTIIVDDSAPHCFSSDLAKRRFEDRRDILFTEGGSVRLEAPIHEILYYPEFAGKILTNSFLDNYIKGHDPHRITGCFLSSLLTNKIEGIKPVIGPAEIETSVECYHSLKRMGIQAADLHCETYSLSLDLIQEFRKLTSC